jgi:thiol-disulfide isomerase/thioredoxin
MPSAGEYKDYGPDAVAQAQKAGSKVVLFFHADWCPFCVEADKQFKAKLDQIPPGVTIFKTPYDTETALKQKYGVTYQHTFVQIDAKGNMATKWNGGDIANLKKYIK